MHQHLTPASLTSSLQCIGAQVRNELNCEHASIISAGGFLFGLELVHPALLQHL